MRVIGLDLGTSCGYAWTDDGIVRATQSGVWNLKPQRHEGGGMRFLRFKRMLEDLIDYPKKTLHRGPYVDGVNYHWEDPPAVFYEEVRGHRGTDAAHIYGGLLAVLQSVCESRKVPYRGIPVGTIKKRATGRGNANKAAMVSAAAYKFAVVSDAMPHDQIDDDNQADALWCLQCGVEELGLGPDENA